MEARSAAERDYNIFVQCFPNDNFNDWFIKATMNILFPFLSQNNSGNIFYSFYTKLYVNQYCIFHIVYLLLPEDNLKNTHEYFSNRLFIIFTFHQYEHFCFYSAQLQR